MPIYKSGPTPPYRRVMIFIDGGYLREYLKKKFGNDEFSFDGFRQLTNSLIRSVNWKLGVAQGELIRIYYYDAMVEENEREKRQKQRTFFRILSQMDLCTIRLGRLVKTEEGYRQKGVDILMAIDVLTKAYENHYEIAILVAGDGDFVNLVKAVKDAGKRVCGAYIPNYVSDKLRESLDLRVDLTGEILSKLIA